MQKLKIRQYWTKQTNKPWYVIRYGHSPKDYIVTSARYLNETISVANSYISNYPTNIRLMRNL